MANEILTGKRIILYYEKGSYSFGALDQSISKEEAYELAAILNGLQGEPPEEICLMTRTTVI